MRAEPGGHLAKASKEARALAQRIKQQDKHHQRTDDAQPVADPGIGADIFFLAVGPAK